MVEVCFKVLQSRSQNKVMKVVHLFMFCKLWLCNTANLKKNKKNKKNMEETFVELTKPVYLIT